MNTMNNPLDQFIANWKEEARKYYMNLADQRRQIRNESEVEITFESLMTMKGQIGTGGLIIRNEEEARSIMEDLEAVSKYKIENIIGGLRSNLLKEWKKDKTQSDLAVLDSMYSMVEFERIIDREAESKKRKLITSLEKKIGSIVDVKGLRIGHDGSLNGFIIGETGKATVETIYAGGYNIQKLHYRTLIRVIK